MLLRTLYQRMSSAMFSSDALYGVRDCHPSQSPCFKVGKQYIGSRLQVLLDCRRKCRHLACDGLALMLMLRLIICLVAGISRNYSTPVQRHPLLSTQRKFVTSQMDKIELFTNAI